MKKDVKFQNKHPVEYVKMISGRIQISPTHKNYESKLKSFVIQKTVKKIRPKTDEPNSP